MALDRLLGIRAVLGRAYAEDPLSEWIFRDPATRTAACATWYGLFVEAYLRNGHVSWLADELAVCLWRTSDDPPLEWAHTPSPAGLLEALVGTAHAQRVGDALHPVGDLTPGEPHVYVNFLAVDPERQGRGAGRRALAPALDAARRAGVGVALESTNPRNLAFYERLGFRPRAEVALGDGPRLVALWLEPDQAGSRHIG